MSKYVIGMVLGLCATPVHAGSVGGYYSAGGLVGLCQSNETVCRAYLAGASDVSEGLNFSCSFQGRQSSELQNLFLTYMNSHTSSWGIQAGIVVSNMLRETYPCNVR